MRARLVPLARSLARSPAADGLTSVPFPPRKSTTLADNMCVLTAQPALLQASARAPACSRARLSLRRLVPVS